MTDSATPNAIGSEILIDRYRGLIANSLLKLYDSCKVHDFLQNIRRNMENDNGMLDTYTPLFGQKQTMTEIDVNNNNNNNQFVCI